MGEDEKRTQKGRKWNKRMATIEQDEIEGNRRGEPNLECRRRGTNRVFRKRTSRARVTSIKKRKPCTHTVV